MVTVLIIDRDSNSRAIQLCGKIARLSPQAEELIDGEQVRPGVVFAGVANSSDPKSRD